MLLRGFLFALAVVFTSAAFADPGGDAAEGEQHHFGLGLEPHWLLIGGLGARFDARLNDRFSLVLGGMYVPSHALSSGQETGDATVSYDSSLYEVYLGTAIMITGDYDHHGFFVTPAIGYTGASISNYGILGLSGSINTAEVRVTGGYQFVVKNFRFLLGAGLRVTNEADVVIKDNSGNELVRERSSSLGGLVLDFSASYLL